jgi:DNA-binding NtrC family response regulator
MKPSVLIVEDQFIEANNLRKILTQAGYEVLPIAYSVADAQAIISKKRPDLVLLDIRLQGPLTGIDLAKILKKDNIAFVYLSANSNKKVLDQAVETKPYGFLVKPFREKDVLVMLSVAAYLHDHNRELEQVSIKKPVPEAKPGEVFSWIVGKSNRFLEALENVKIVGHADTSVLILGESGTGKELIAQAIHSLSPRKDKPLIVVNCGALPPNLIESELFGHEKGSFTGATEKRIGKFEQADGGTIFLDEVGELPLDLQVKFLRVLQEKEIETIGGKKKKVDIRVIAATNRNLEDELLAGTFRMDLYYRLSVFPITLPPLRDRKEDILLLAQYFLDRASRKQNKVVTGIADHVGAELLTHTWPGNVRELENLMERSVLLAAGPVIESVDLTLKKQVPLKGTERPKSIMENERDHILAALVECEWKIYGKGGAAELLDINPSTLNSRIKKLNITKKIIPE